MPASAGVLGGGGSVQGVPDVGVSLAEQEQKTQLEREVSRSRIPRLVLRPQPKVSPASESPFSEEESREFNPPSSSGCSGRTISSNSFCSGTADSPPPPLLSPQPGGHGGSPCADHRGSAVILKYSIRAPGSYRALTSILLCRRRATTDFGWKNSVSLHLMRVRKQHQMFPSQVLPSLLKSWWVHCSRAVALKRKICLGTCSLDLRRSNKREKSL